MYSRLPLLVMPARSNLDVCLQMQPPLPRAVGVHANE